MPGGKVKSELKITYVKADEMNDLIAAPPEEVPQGLYIAVNGPYWIGMDNRQGEAAVNDFADDESVEAWFQERTVG